MRSALTSLRVDDIGYTRGRYFALVAVAAGREWVLSDSRAIRGSAAELSGLVARIRAAGTIDTQLWEPTSMTDSEREVHWADMAEWEYTEQQAGRW